MGRLDSLSISGHTRMRIMVKVHMVWGPLQCTYYGSVKQNDTAALRIEYTAAIGTNTIYNTNRHSIILHASESHLCHNISGHGMVTTLFDNVYYLKGLAQDKIIKKSLILFWLLNMTI